MVGAAAIRRPFDRRTASVSAVRHEFNAQIALNLSVGRILR